MSQVSVVCFRIPNEHLIVHIGFVSAVASMLDSIGQPRRVILTDAMCVLPLAHDTDGIVWRGVKTLDFSSSALMATVRALPEFPTFRRRFIWPRFHCDMLC